MLLRTISIGAFAFTVLACSGAAETTESSQADRTPEPSCVDTATDAGSADTGLETPIATCFGAYQLDGSTPGYVLRLHRTAEGCQFDEFWRLNDDGTATYLLGDLEGYRWTGDKYSFGIGLKDPFTYHFTLISDAT